MLLLAKSKAAVLGWLSIGGLAYFGVVNLSFVTCQPPSVSPYRFFEWQLSRPLHCTLAWLFNIVFLMTAVVIVHSAWHRTRVAMRQRLAARGLCPSCGYDLRATPSRCPECGSIPPQCNAAAR